VLVAVVVVLEPVWHLVVLVEVVMVPVVEFPQPPEQSTQEAVVVVDSPTALELLVAPVLSSLNTPMPTQPRSPAELHNQQQAAVVTKSARSQPLAQAAKR